MAELNVGRLEKLGGFLKSVSPVLAAKLARAIELDKVRGGALPHEAILEGLRPRLRELQRRLDRLPSPQRLICTVFEDLLLPGPRFRKQKGRIARTSIEPVWRWLTRTLLAESAPPLLDAIRKKLVSGAEQFIDVELNQFHAMASQAIIAAIPEGDLRAPAALAALGGEDVVGDAYDMARMMEIAPLISGLQRQLTRPIHALEERDIQIVRSVWETAIAEHSDAAPYVVFFILGRLDKPWEALRLAGALSRRMDDTLVSRTDAGMVGDVLLSDLEDCGLRLAAMRPGELRAADAIAAVIQFGNLSTGIVRELGIKRDGVWGKRLMAARAAVADQMERLLGRATKEISATLPMTRRSGPGFGFRGRRVPDLTRNLDRQKAERALQLAALAGGVRQHAAAGAFGAIIVEIDEKAGGLLRHYTTDMIDELAVAPAALREQAEAFVHHAVALTHFLMSPDEADIIRRRATAALEAHDRREAEAPAAQVA